MNMLIVRHRTLFLVLYNLIIITPMIFPVLFFGLSFGVFIAWDFISITTSFAMAQSARLKEHEKIMKKLEQDCDPYVALEQLGELKRTIKTKPFLQLIDLNIALCLLETGKQEESFELLQSINIDEHIGTQNITKVVYYNNLSCRFADKNNLIIAKFLLEKGFQILKTITIKPAIKSQLEIILNNTRIELGMKEGKTEGAYEWFQYAIEHSKSNLQTATVYYSLGELYLMDGHTEQAKECFLHTVQLGNRLYTAELAKKQIEKLSSNSL